MVGILKFYGIHIYMIEILGGTQLGSPIDYIHIDL
jgi:hypothetical protein